MDLSALFAQALAQHPTLAVTSPDFEAGWQARSRETALEPERAADVLLAIALERADAAAVTWLRREITGALQQVGHRVPRQVWDDIESDVVMRLTVGSETAGARIRDYTGRGPLAAWVRVVVVRHALSRAPAPSRSEENDLEQAVLDDVERSAVGLDVKLLRARLKGVLGPALVSAIGRLEPRERSLLRLHFLEGATLEDLARSYGVHAATVSRWLAAAKASFLTATRDAVAPLVGVGRMDVDSLVRALEGSLDVSLHRVLRSTAEPS
jgi:RNA polymerase sigma-70 factor, ECF subfamily